MYSGFYTVASGVLVNQKSIDTISNNLVNSQTPGYRADTLVESAFEKELLTRSDSEGAAVLGDGIGAYAVTVDGLSTSFESGQLKETGRGLDMAINGEGFFNIRGTDGNTYLTRNGSFTVDDAGYLALQGVGRVQGENGDIAVNSSDMNVSANGTVKDKNGNTLGKLLITAPNDYTTLEKNENGLFTSTAQMNVSGNYQLLQGRLELSNVDMNTEMTNLIATQRALQNCASALRTIDALDQKASSQIAAV